MLDSSNSEQRERWQLNRHINVGQIFSGGVIIAAIFFAYSDLDKRVSVNSQDMAHMVRAQESQNDRINAMREELRGELQNLNNKLDRLIRFQLRQASSLEFDDEIEGGNR